MSGIILAVALTLATSSVVQCQVVDNAITFEFNRFRAHANFRHLFTYLWISNVNTSTSINIVIPLGLSCIHYRNLMSTNPNYGRYLIGNNSYYSPTLQTYLLPGVGRNHVVMPFHTLSQLPYNVSFSYRTVSVGEFSTRDHSVTFFENNTISSGPLGIESTTRWLAVMAHKTDILEPISTLTCLDVGIGIADNVTLCRTANDCVRYFLRCHNTECYGCSGRLSLRNHRPAGFGLEGFPSNFI